MTSISSATPQLSPKMELASCLAKNLCAHTEALRAIFEKQMRDLAQSSLTWQTTPEETERIWTVVSHDRLQHLKDTYLFELREKVLCTVHEPDVPQLLEQYKSDGHLSDPTVCERIQNDYATHQEAILEKVQQRAEEMDNEFLRSDILDAIEDIRGLDPETDRSRSCTIS